MSDPTTTIDPLAALLAFHAAKEAKRDAAKQQAKEKKPSKLAERRAREAAEREAAKVPSQSPTVIGGISVGVYAPPVGTLDPRSFLAARRAAFSTTGEVQIPFLPPSSRDAQIVALRAFQGYNPREHFGAQDMRATMEANRLLRPSTARSTDPLYRESAAHQRQVKGYVPGLPNGEARIVRDLIARERLAVDTIAEHAKAINEGSLTFKDEETGEELPRDGAIQLEQARLIEIRQQLHSHGG